jgi:UrcA family protein
MRLPAFAFAALGSAMLAAGAVPAAASDAPKQQTTLSYADLDLGTADGRAELNRRFDQAAREKCGMAEGQKTTVTQRYCYKTAAVQYRSYASVVLADHDRAQQDKRYGLAAR